MTVLEGLALSLVLLSALYGCACLITNAVCAMWRPKEPHLRLVVTLCGDEDNVEQKLQFARLLSVQTRIPLTVNDEGMSEEARKIADVIVGPT